MTPLSRFLTKHLPQGAVAPVLALVYSATLLAVVLLIGRVEQHLMYLDIAGGR